MDGCCAASTAAKPRHRIRTTLTNFNRTSAAKAYLRHGPETKQPILDVYTRHMDFLHRIAEERIQKAQEEGLFDNLEGRGKPLDLDDDSWVPEDLRLTYKILKNAN